MSELVTEAGAAVDADLRQSLEATMMALGAIKAVGEAGTSYDQLLASGNDAGDARCWGQSRR